MKAAVLALSLAALLTASLATATSVPSDPSPSTLPATPLLAFSATGAGDGHDATGAAAASTPPPTIQDGIGPGSALHQHDNSGDSSGYICTGAFLLRDPATATYYLSTAGHCLVLDADDPAVYTGAANADKLKEEILVCVAQCIANALSFGTYVTLTAGDGYHPVTYARSGGIGEDFGIIEIPDEHHLLLRPALPQWGGPTGLADDAGAMLVHYGHGSYCCPSPVGSVATRTPADQGRVAYTVSSGSTTFEAVGWVTGGDSGSGISVGAPDASGLVRGNAALGVITHATEGTGSLFTGTMLAHGIEMVREATGLQLELVLEGDPLDAVPQGPPAGNGTADIAILTPAPGATVRPVDGAVRIGGRASFGPAANGSRIEVAIDDPQYGFDSRLLVEGDTDWEATWYPGSAVAGVHTLRARLVGADGEVLDQTNQTVRLDKSGSGKGSSAGTGSGDGLPNGEGEAAAERPVSVDVPALPPPMLVGVLLAVAAFVAARRR